MDIEGGVKLQPSFIALDFKFLCSSKSSQLRSTRIIINKCHCLLNTKRWAEHLLSSLGSEREQL